MGVTTLSRKPITSSSVRARFPFFNSIFLIIIDNYSYPDIVIGLYLYCACNWEAGSRKGQGSWRDNKTVQSDAEGGRRIRRIGGPTKNCQKDPRWNEAVRVLDRRSRRNPSRGAEEGNHHSP